MYYKSRHRRRRQYRSKPFSVHVLLGFWIKYNPDFYIEIFSDFVKY